MSSGTSLTYIIIQSRKTIVRFQNTNSILKLDNFFRDCIIYYKAYEYVHNTVSIAETKCLTFWAACFTSKPKDNNECTRLTLRQWTDFGIHIVGDVQVLVSAQSGNTFKHQRVDVRIGGVSPPSIFPDYAPYQIAIGYSAPERY